MRSERTCRWVATWSIGTTLAAVGVLPLSGCAPSRASSGTIASENDIPRGSPANAGSWIFWPTSMRIHPLTRANTASTPPSVDVRLEFFDSDQNATRAVGTVVVVLRCAAADPAEQRFVFPLLTRDENATHFNTVTDTYGFTIVPTWRRAPAPGSGFTVDAFLFGLDGSDPSASMRLTW